MPAWFELAKKRAVQPEFVARGMKLRPVTPFSEMTGLLLARKLPLLQPKLQSSE